MEKLIQAAREIIASMRMDGDCPRCMAVLETEEHADVNGGICPYDALNRALRVDLGPADLSLCAHDGKYYVFKMDQDAEPIPADEPVFVLRAQDKYASATVRYYGLRPLTVAAHTQIFDIADAMDAWPFHKEPD